MAIVIEEESNKISIVQILVWLGILAVIGIAVYYIFFAEPQTVDVVIPSDFQNVERLSVVEINPEEIVNDYLGSLKEHVTPPAPGNAGRQNPFLPL